jgi:hypothetical protein
VTVNGAPAIVSVPIRSDVCGFAATLKATEPFPLPLPPAVTEIQLAPDPADHEQPAGAVTDAEPVPPDAPTLWLSGSTS